MYSIDQLREIYNRGDRIRAKTELSNYIKSLTPYLPDTAFPKQRLWHILNNTTDIPKCKMCDNLVNWDDAKPTVQQQYRAYCSHKCLHNDPDQKAKKLKTEIKRYGKGRSFIVQKIKKTNQERYGADFAIQTSNAQEKQKQTNLERYGVENVIQNDQVQFTRELTNVKKFGVKAPAQNDDIKQRMTDTCISRYGSVEQRNQMAHEKYLNTCMNKYGVMFHTQSHYDDNTFDVLLSKGCLEFKHLNQRLSQTAISKQLKVAQSTIGRYFKHYDINTIRYPSSNKEVELYNLIKSLLPEGTEIITNTRDIIAPQEIDIYVPSMRLAFEFNGIYWHSDLNGKDKNYHLQKTIQCESKDIRLVHIFENEWETKQEVVKSRISSLLRCNQTIYARKTIIQPLTRKQVSIFWQENHIQGDATSSVAYGLFYNNELVAAMSFCKSRYDKKIDWELLRYANTLNTSVVGGASKLFKHFVKQHSPISIISYSDKRWNTGNLYTNLGFTHSHISAPNYWYFSLRETSILYHRTVFQKHKLSKQLPMFDPELTEWQNMVNNGYDRIWDCGNDVYTWKNVDL